MKSVKVIINGQEALVQKNSSILQAAKELGIEIPNLCHCELLDIGKGASCRVCVVEVEGRRNLAPACATTVAEGMVINTKNDRVKKTRNMMLELLLANHPLDCLTCQKSGNCKLQDYCYEYDVKESRFKGEKRNIPVDESNEFYICDPNKCIMCGNCVRVCSELQCTSAIGRTGRGFNTYVGAPYEEGMKKSTCVSCGNCLSVCPVGALMPKQKSKYRLWELKRVKTTCTYCGVGCQMNLLVKDNKVVESEPVVGLANNGLLCVKGKFGNSFIKHPDRLKTPLIKKDGKFEEASWEEAIEVIVSKVKSTKAEYGPDALAGLASARCTNEENYLFQKMVRTTFGTNNIDHCARLCHASTVAGLAITLGSGAMTNSNQEATGTDVILITGSNTTETHPVIGSFMKQAIARGAKVIVAEPRRIELAEQAEVFLQIKPGTNVAIYNGLMNVILEENLQDIKYIKERTENYEELVEVIKNYTPERVAGICGVDAEDIRKAARLYAKADKAAIYYSMGVTQHSTGTQGVMSISNLALLCGNIGKEFCGVNPLRGQNNVQGACDTGCLPGDLTGYQKVANPDSLAKFEKAWGVKLSDKVGLTVTEIMNACEDGDIRFLYIMGENPMISDPDINHVKKALDKLDFLVVQDIFLTETAELADIVLPAASFAEKDGTFTNTERRVQRIRKAIEPVGQAKADWEIIMKIMNALGYEKTYNHASEIMDEIASLTPQYGGIDYLRIEEEGLQWPCPTKDHPGSKYLHNGGFAKGRALFRPAEYIESAELPDKDYPYILTTGRMLYHYHTRSMTGRVEGINNLFPESYIEIHPDTANKLKVKHGDKVKISSRRGEIITSAKVSDIVEEDVLFMPFHFAEGAANYLTNCAIDPIAKIPEFKVCAISVNKA